MCKFSLSPPKAAKFFFRVVKNLVRGGAQYISSIARGGGWFWGVRGGDNKLGPILVSVFCC